MTCILRMTAFVLAASLCGCGVGPVYHRPVLTVPPAFSGQAAPQPDSGALTLAWWHGFGAPELDRLMAKAAAASPDVLAAAARVVQADQAARIAGSPLLPTVSGSLGQSWERVGTGSSGAATTGSTGSIGSTALGSASSTLTAVPGSNQKYFEERSYSAELSASYEVDFWGKNRDALRAAQATALGSRFDAQTVWLTTASSIATTYFQALGYRDRLAIAQHNLATASDVLGYYRGRLTAGLASLLDVSQQEALVAGYRAQIPVLQSEYEQQKLALGILVGEPPETISLSPVPLISLKLPEVAAGLPSELLRRRPDVAYAEEQLVSQNQTVRQDFANFFPSLQLTAQGGLSSAALSMLTGPGTLLLSMSNSITQTIFDNGLKSGTLGEAKGRYKELVADYVKAYLQALTDTETALTQLHYDSSQESLESEAVRVAQQSANIAHAQLEVGTVDIVTVLNTQTTLFGDEDTLAQARISRFLALVSLYKALGGGWSAPPGALAGTSETLPG